MYQAETIISKALDDEDYRLALAAIDRTRSAMELVMRATGQIGQDQTNVYVDQRKASMALFSQLTIEELRALASGVPIAALEKPQETIEA
jgi:hypothetical protein